MNQLQMVEYGNGATKTFRVRHSPQMYGKMKILAKIGGETALTTIEEVLWYH